MLSEIEKLIDLNHRLNKAYEERNQRLEDENEKLKKLLCMSLDLLKTYDYERSMKILEMMSWSKVK